MIPARPLLPLAALLLSCAGPTGAHGPRSPLLGKGLEVSAQDLSGQDVRVAPRGRVLVVDFFASWCVPCRAQFPHLDGLVRELSDRGLEVVAISFDEEAAAARAFAADLGARFPVLWDKGGERLAPALGVERLPTTLVLDRQGIVRHVHQGFDAREGARLEAEVRALLAEAG